MASSILLETSTHFPEAVPFYNATSKKMSDSVPLHPHEHWPLSLVFTVAILTGVSLYLIGALNLYVLNN